MEMYWEQQRVNHYVNAEATTVWSAK